MKQRVQQLIQSFTAASNPGVVEFDFEGLEVLEEVCHDQCALCSSELRGQMPQAACPMLERRVRRAGRIGAVLHGGREASRNGSRTKRLGRRTPDSRTRSSILQIFPR